MGIYRNKSNEELTRIGVNSIERAWSYIDSAEAIVNSLEEELIRTETTIDPKIIIEIKTYELASNNFNDFLYN